MARGFTLVEVLVVTAISLMLMMAGTFIYLTCLKIYRENQEMTEVMQTARLLERDLRDALGNVVPLRGAWITPQVHLFPGQPDAFKNGWEPVSTNTNIGFKSSCIFSSTCNQLTDSRPSLNKGSNDL